MEEACNKNENLFVHCQIGKSRSVAFIAAYLIKFMRMKLDDALVYIQRIRRTAYPNYGFIQELREFEKQKLYFVLSGSKFQKKNVNVFIFEDFISLMY